MNRLTTNIHFVINPVAGGATSVKVWPKVATFLMDNNIPFTKYTSAFEGNTFKIAQKIVAENDKQVPPIIIGIGGDGTLNEIINGVKTIDQPSIIGIIPAGSGNDFVNSQKFDKNLKKYLTKIFLHPDVKTIDIGVMVDNVTKQKRYFVNNLGIGFDAAVVYKTNSHASAKKVLNSLRIGKVAYGYNAVSTYISQSDFPMTLSYINNANQEVTFTEEHAYLLSVTNIPLFGGGIPIAPEASLHDQLLDAVLFTNPSRRQLLHSLINLVRGNHLNKPNVEYFQLKKIHLLSNVKNIIQLDGEVYLPELIDMEITTDTQQMLF